MTDGIGWYGPHPDAVPRGHPGRDELGDDGRVLHDGSAVAVVALGAVCGLREAPSASSDGTTHYWVGEFAGLADGRRIVLHEERGFSIGPPMGATTAPGERRHMGRDEIIRTVLDVVLPDDEHPAVAHPFEWLASLAARRGLNVTTDDLRSLPYDVVLSAAVEAMLSFRPE